MWAQKNSSKFLLVDSRMWTILGFVGSGLLGAFGKGIYDQVSTSECFVRYRVACNVKHYCTKLIKLNEYPVIQLYSLEKHISSALRDTGGGVWLLGAPSGSGKSTYLDHCIKSFKMTPDAKDVCVFQGVDNLKDKNIHVKLGVPSLEPISRYIPHGTVIVIDQVDCSIAEMNDKVKSYIIDLATDSYNSKSYSVVISVSDPAVMRALIKLNAMQKVKDICDPKFLKWSSSEAKEYIDKTFKSWTAQDKEALLEASKRSYSPGALHYAHKLSLDTGRSKDEVITCANKWDIEKKKEWNNFDKELEDHPFYVQISVLSN